MIIFIILQLIFTISQLINQCNRILPKLHLQTASFVQTETTEKLKFKHQIMMKLSQMITWVFFCITNVVIVQFKYAKQALLDHQSTHLHKHQVVSFC